ncbi:MAG: hypothetical protein EOP66_15025 [Sphingomonas sp.]|nr:MAG: hypothetical protein EOP66_15025 [Sphingomonas sp.]
MEDVVDWYVEACLCLRSGIRGKKASELFRGQIGEAVHVALGRPEDERARLFIQCDTIDARMPWAKIAQLAARPDFPVIV